MFVPNLVAWKARARVCERKKDGEGKYTDQWRRTAQEAKAHVRAVVSGGCDDDDHHLTTVF